MIFLLFVILRENIKVTRAFLRPSAPEFLSVHSFLSVIRVRVMPLLYLGCCFVFFHYWQVWPRMQATSYLLSSWWVHFGVVFHSLFFLPIARAKQRGDLFQSAYSSPPSFVDLSPSLLIFCWFAPNYLPSLLSLDRSFLVRFFIVVISNRWNLRVFFCVIRMSSLSICFCAQIFIRNVVEFVIGYLYITVTKHFARGLRISLGMLFSVFWSR
jgi:hypothetical protein